MPGKRAYSTLHELTGLGFIKPRKWHFAVEDEPDFPGRSLKSGAQEIPVLTIPHLLGFSTAPKPTL
jgi:hypothetical protein